MTPYIFLPFPVILFKYLFCTFTIVRFPYLNKMLKDFKVVSDKVKYTDDEIHSKYEYSNTIVEDNGLVKPEIVQTEFKTDRKVPKLGLMLVGWGGCNGTTISAGILANKKSLKWNTKDGENNSNYYGSLTQCSTIKLGNDRSGNPIYIPFNKILPMVDPNDIIVGGWDISEMNIGDAMRRSAVLDWDLQKQVYDSLKELHPLPGIYDSNFIADNQKDRVNHTIKGNKLEQIAQIKKDIKEFKINNQVDKVIVLWTANTERYADIIPGMNDTSENLLNSIKRNEKEIAPSTLYAIACIEEGVSYINGSPQNTFVPGVMEYARAKDVFIAGDDFKSGQTKMKSVLVDFLVSSGIKPTSIVSYNHLGNNDGKNLSAPEQFRSKEISKSNVVDDMVSSNRLLYNEGETPDHCVVIKYVPNVGDSKRAMDEYTSDIFMGGRNTIVMHNTCEDSLLAAPIILDLVILCELSERIKVKFASEDKSSDFEKFDVVLSILSFMLKAPLVPEGTPIVNALQAQRQCIINIFRACVGLSPEHYMALEHKLSSTINTINNDKKRKHKEMMMNGMNANGSIDEKAAS